MIANAGISYRKKTYDQPIAESLRIIDVNVKGVMNTFEAAISFMRQQESGHIVAMSSIAASNGLPTRAAYSASKNAVQIWCESMAIELSRFGVVVSCVKPGFIKSHLTSGNQHAMPFALTIEETVQNILSGIKKQKFLITFPWPMVWLTNLLSFLPRPLYILIMKIGAGWLQDKKE
jgi:short-subunit dehydrogenase